MLRIDTAEITVAGYENVYFICSVCKRESILNRASDTDCKPISGMEVLCQNEACSRKLWMHGDRFEPAQYQWFLKELPILKSRKLYRDYALTLCECAEKFFLQAVINKKFDMNPIYRDEDNINRLRMYNTDLEEYKWMIKGYTFDRMRELFLKVRKDEIDKPTKELDRLKEDKRVWSRKVIRNSQINSLRNRVAHKEAYRPTLTDIEEHDDFVEALTWLGLYLYVLDSDFVFS